MKNFFPLNAQPTKEQKVILQAGANLIIKGAAGTGKTFLAILLAEKITKKSDITVAIVILTKSLKKFITESLKERSIERCKVYLQKEWNNALSNTLHFNYIIIDEAQDFSLKQIQEIKQFCTLGIYILGDSKQRILEQNNNEKTTTMEEIEKEFKLPVKTLTTNVRFHDGIRGFICEAFPGVELGNSLSNDTIKPLIIYCDSPNEEIQKISSIIKEGSLQGSTGIFLQRNDQTDCNSGNEPFLISGIMEMFQALKKDGVKNIGYKYRQSENLSFDSENTVNILTYHSAKGLEFDNVILPFLTSIYDLGTTNLYYVGASRARKKIIILYSKSFSVQLPIKNHSIYEGKIKNPRFMKLANHYISLYNISLDQEKNRQELNQAIECLRLAGLNDKEVEDFIISKKNH